MSVAPASTPTPKVSVVIPCYNRERYVGQAIQSVLDQTWPNIELVVVDDGSTDGSMAVLQSFGDRIRVLQNAGGVNKGQSASINLGLANVDGEYIAILDSDDWWSVDKLESHVRFLDDHPEIGLVYGNGRWVWENKPGRDWRMYPPDHRESSDPARVLMDCYFALPGNAVMRREVLEKAGPFDESLRSAQDHDMAIRVTEVTRIAYLPGERFFYRRHADSISHRNLESRWRNGLVILEKAARRYPYPSSILRRRRAILHFRIGQALWQKGSHAAATPHFLGAAIRDPWRAVGVLLGREQAGSPAA